MFKKNHYSVFFQADFITFSEPFLKDYAQINDAIELIKNNDLKSAQFQIRRLNQNLRQHLFIKGLEFLIAEQSNPLPEYRVFNKNINSYFSFFHRIFIEKSLLWSTNYFSDLNDQFHRESVMANSCLLAFLGEISLYRFVSLFKKRASAAELGNALLMGTALISCAEMMNANQPKLNFKIFLQRPLRALPHPYKAQYQKIIADYQVQILDKYIEFNLRTNYSWRDSVQFLNDSYIQKSDALFEQLDNLISESPENWGYFQHKKYLIQFINLIDFTARLLWLSEEYFYLDLGSIDDTVLPSLERHMKNVLFFTSKRRKKVLKDYLSQNSSVEFKKLLRSEKLVKEFFAKLF
jgi:hypothetical protein